MTAPSAPDQSQHRPLAAAAFGLLLAAAFLVTGCQQANGGMPEMPPPEVTTIPVKAEKIGVTYEYVGQTEGSREVEVRARVTGIVINRWKVQFLRSLMKVLMRGRMPNRTYMVAMPGTDWPKPSPWLLLGAATDC